MGSNVGKGTVSRRKLRPLLALAALLVALPVAACGGDESEPSSTPAGGSSAATSGWDGVVEAAKKEGSVTILSSQGLDQLNAMAAKFTDKYGIKVNVVRAVDGENLTRLTAEHDTNKPTADMWVVASEPMINDAVSKGWPTKPTGPEFSGGAYDTSLYMRPGDVFEVGAAILGFGWNTKLFPKGLQDEQGLLDPSLKGGKIGVLEPTAPVIVDQYLYLESKFGEDFIKQLGAQKPRIYPSTLPTQQALASGEIAAAPMTNPSIVDLKSQGAPIEFKLPDSPWAARYIGMVLKQAPNPNAAQLLADYMITPEGQAEVNKGYAAVLEDVPGALATNESVRKMNEDDLTPDKVKAFQDKWNEWYR